MTRETKIGLLVGLGFIIVIGILLSDHIQSSTEPPSAQLANAAPNVLSAVNAPNAQPTVPTNVTAPENVSPPQPVMTQEEMANKPEPTKIIVVGPADNSKPVDIRAENAQVVRNTGENVPVGLEANKPKDENIALVPVGPETSFVNPQPTQPKAKMTVYKAVANDTLAKITKKVYGADTMANRKLILAANKDLKGASPKIVVGHAYNIPAKVAELASGHVVSPVLSDKALTANDIAGPTTKPSNKTPSTSVPTVLYTVKDGDSLWKIAKSQCGSANAMAQIRELNKDVLKNDQLKLNMKLKLPAKSAVASVETN